MKLLFLGSHLVTFRNILAYEAHDLRPVYSARRVTIAAEHKIPG